MVMFDVNFNELLMHFQSRRSVLTINTIMNTANMVGGGMRNRYILRFCNFLHKFWAT